jgi:hypothetical protein
MNGHEWLERKLTANGISFTKHDNAFLRVDDWDRAQKLLDRFVSKDQTSCQRELVENVR